PTLYYTFLLGANYFAVGWRYSGRSGILGALFWAVGDLLGCYSGRSGRLWEIMANTPKAYRIGGENPLNFPGKK
ncbi:MAG: hypothetical protein RSE98_07320, partial [Anaerovoracaceae bacterium]